MFVSLTEELKVTGLVRPFIYSLAEWQPRRSPSAQSRGDNSSTLTPEELEPHHTATCERCRGTGREIRAGHRRPKISR